MSEFGQRRFRPALLLGVMVLALGASLLIAPVRSAAEGLLDVFRVEKFAAVTVDVSQLPMARQHMPDAHDSKHEPEERDLNVFGTYSGPTKPERGQAVGTLKAAEDLVGDDLADAGKQLAGRQQTNVFVTKEVRASYTFDTDKIRAKLDRAGMRNVRVPRQIDGKTFTVNVPRGVIVQYGAEKGSPLFIQGPSPTLTVPEGVNMEYLRQDFLMIPGLPQDLVAQVQQIEDWEHTLIIPLPPQGKSTEVKIKGSEGLLISDRTGEHTAVLWQRDGKLYAILGKMSSSEALNAARSVKYP